MLALSVGMHIALLAFLVVGSQYLNVRPKLTEPGVTSVRLVESMPSRLSAPEQLVENTQEDLQPVSKVDSEEIHPVSNPKTETLKTVFAKADPVEPVIQMKKRKQKPEKIESKKKEKEAKPLTDKTKKEPEKKNNPNEFLEKRLAAIKKSVETKKSEKPQNSIDKGLETPAGAGSRVSGNGTSGDAEISKWFDAVRKRINSNWSVFADEQRAPKVTIISLQLSDEGTLINASIDISSGDRFFDGSAMRAVHQAAPFPAMSSDVSAKIRAAGGLALRFTPGGIQ
ncbi:MAG: cell envelope integrity protein TolA [Pseudomonadota bacterium]